MKAFSALHADNLALLVNPSRGPDACVIPLFTDDHGWDYQIRLHIGGGSGLPRVQCPSVLSDDQLCSPSVFELSSHIKVGRTFAVDTIPIAPSMAVTLGKLVVRNDYRSPSFFPAGEHVTEDTDYSVVVGVGYNDMPVWLLAPRPQLQKRFDCPFRVHPVPFLPIFDGLLANQDNDAYDCARILPSVRRLSARPPDSDAPSYQEACELVRRTRATTDPQALILPQERCQRFLGNRPLRMSFDMVPYSELRLSGEDEGPG